MSMTILGLATAEPATVDRAVGGGPDCTDISARRREARLLPALFQRTQVRSRGSVLLGIRQWLRTEAVVLSADQRAVGSRPGNRLADATLRGRVVAAGRGGCREVAGTGRDRPGGDHASDHGFLHGLLCPGARHRPGQAPGTFADGGAAARRIHGLPRRAQRPASGEGHGDLPIRRRSCSSCAVELCSLHYQYGDGARRAGGQCPLCRRRRCAGWPGFCRQGRPMAVGFQRLVPSAGLRRRNDLEDRRPRF